MKRSKHEPRAIATQKGIANHSDWIRNKSHHAVRTQPGLLSGQAEWLVLVQYPSHCRYYYRLQWGIGAKSLGQQHIPGGNVGSKTADNRAAEVCRWIEMNRSREDILELIASWGRSQRQAKQARQFAEQTAKQLQFLGDRHEETKNAG